MPISEKDFREVMNSCSFEDESKNWILSVNKCCPEWADILLQMTDKEGKQLFDIVDICDIYNCNYMDLMRNPEKVKAVLEDEEALKSISSYTNKGFGLRCNIKSPLPSVKSKHSELFEKKTEEKDEKTTNKKVDKNKYKSVCLYNRDEMCK